MSAAVVIAVSLAFVLAIAGGLTLLWRKQVRHRHDETPEHQYRHAIRDLKRLSDGPPPKGPTVWPSGGGYDAGGGGG
jgi:hypothetical protein